MKKWALGVAALLASFPAIAVSASAASYTVKQGDTLWSIATANSITVSQLMSYNGLASSYLQPGQTLKLPITPDYIVRAGDTVWSIAQKHGIPINVLLKANPQITNANMIIVGTGLMIPKKPAAFLTGMFPLQAGTYTPYVNNYADERTWTPDGSGSRKHEGVDILAVEGTPIYAAVPGTVVNVGWSTFGGYRLTVKASGGIAIYYAHMQKYEGRFTVGQQVEQGQLIGYVGNTGYGPEGTKGKFVSHLHFGMYNTDISPWEPIDPSPYLKWWEYKL